MIDGRVGMAEALNERGRRWKSQTSELGGKAIHGDDDAADDTAASWTEKKPNALAWKSKRIPISSQIGHRTTNSASNLA